MPATRARMGEAGARYGRDRRDASDTRRRSRWGRDAEPGPGLRGDDRRLPAGLPERSRGQERGDRPRGLARQRLAAAGVAGIHGGGFCTASEERFFSFRRDETTGRMASLIWLEED